MVGVLHAFLGYILTGSGDDKEENLAVWSLEELVRPDVWVATLVNVLSPNKIFDPSSKDCTLTCMRPVLLGVE